MYLFHFFIFYRLVPPYGHLLVVLFHLPSRLSSMQLWGSAGVRGSLPVGIPSGEGYLPYLSHPYPAQGGRDALLARHGNFYPYA